MPTGAYIFGAQIGAYISLEHTFGDGAYISKPAGQYIFINWKKLRRVTPPLFTAKATSH